MGKREVHPPQANTPGTGCLIAVAALAAAGVLLVALMKWVWPLVLIVPAAALAVVIVRERLVIAAAARHLRASRKRALLVYSNSPVWKDYIDTQWLPRLSETVEILNWSERRQWSSSDPLVRLFRTCVGEREDFNPSVVLLRDRGAPLVFRFYPAFRNAKHGNRDGLHRLERELFAAIGNLP